MNLHKTSGSVFVSLRTVCLTPKSRSLKFDATQRFAIGSRQSHRMACNQVWPSFISIDKLVNPWTGYLIGDKLTLLCEVRWLINFNRTTRQKDFNL